MNSSRKLAKLTESGVILGMKAETESEGMDWQSISYLAGVAQHHRIMFDLKIGGCEAKTDIYTSQNYHVSSIIAPMIETPFAAIKFRSALESFSLLGKNSPKLLIETQTAVENIEEILDAAEGWVAGINFGRTDLLASMQFTDPSVASFDNPKFEMVLLKGIQQARKRGYATTFGGGLTVSTISKMSPELRMNIPDKFESRRFIYDAKKVIQEPNLLVDGLELEKLLVEDLLAISSSRTQSLTLYLAQLSKRIDSSASQVGFL